MPDSTIRPLNIEEIDVVSGGMHGDVSFNQAYNDFQSGGAHLGYGAAQLVSGAWTGIALTPSLILNSLSHTSLLGGLLGSGGLLGGLLSS